MGNNVYKKFYLILRSFKHTTPYMARVPEFHRSGDHLEVIQNIILELTVCKTYRYQIYPFHVQG